MAKLSTQKKVQPKINTPIKSKGLKSDTTTYGGGAGFAREAKSELFLLSIANMVGEDTAYEKAADRNDRFKQLVHEVAKVDGDWIRRFIPYLRNVMNMRSASTVMAAEFAAALIDENRLIHMENEETIKLNKQAQEIAKHNGDEEPELQPLKPHYPIRQVVASACVRPDEPAELIGYWYAAFGKTIPKPVKRGLADAVQRLYNERSSLRYDGQTRSIRMADVIEIVHPSASAPWQADLYKYLLDKRHHADAAEIPASLPAVAARERLQNLGTEERHTYMRRVLAGDVVVVGEFHLAMAGQWEWAKSWLGEGGGDAMATGSSD